MERVGWLLEKDVKRKGRGWNDKDERVEVLLEKDVKRKGRGWKDKDERVEVLLELLCKDEEKRKRNKYRKQIS